MALDAQTLSDYGYSPDEIKGYMAKQAISSTPLTQSSGNQNNQSNSFSPTTDQFGKTGVGSSLFNIPIAGGILRNIPSSLESMGRLVGGAGFESARATAGAMGNKKAYSASGPQDPFLSKENLATFSNPIEGLTQGAGIGLNAATTVGSVLNPVNAAKTILKAPQTALKPLSPLLHPINTVGKMLENKAAGAGNVPNDLLEKVFGTSMNPNPKLYQGLSSASGQGELKDLLAKEIGAQGRPAGDMMAQPTYSQMLKNRSGAYTQGYDRIAPKSQQGLYKRIGGAYSDVLKQGANTGTLDNILHMLHGAQNIAPMAAGALGVGKLFDLLSSLKSGK